MKKIRKARKQCKRTAKKVSTKKVLRTLDNARKVAVAAHLTKAAIIAGKTAATAATAAPAVI